jgi:hypothetical protein
MRPERNCGLTLSENGFPRGCMQMAALLCAVSLASGLPK